MSHLGVLGHSRLWRAACISLLPLALSSCGGEHPSALCPTKGQVFFQGEPATGATVILHPASTSGAADWNRGYPSGAVAADGSFWIRTADQELGAPLGEYAVLVVWVPTSAGEERTSEEASVDKLAGRYADAASAKWRVKVAGVSCEIPRIDLE